MSELVGQNEQTPQGGKTRGRFVFQVLRASLWVALVTATAWLLASEHHPDDRLAGLNQRLNLVYREIEGQSLKLDLYYPGAGEAPQAGWPLVVAIHGGGWQGGGKGEYGRQAAWLAKQGYAVASIEYSLSRPGHPSWPACFEDVKEAVRWLRAHAADLGVDRHRVAAMGASAGGHLSGLLATLPDGDEAKVQAGISFYGPMDLPILHQNVPAVRPVLETFLGGEPDSLAISYQQASPLTHVTPRSAPLLLIHGQQDLIVPVDQSQRMANALKAVHAVVKLEIVPEARHGFGFEYGSREFRSLLLDFLTQVWQHGSHIPS